MNTDIVFCRTWVPVTPKKFSNPVTTLYAPPDRAQRRKAELQAEAAAAKQQQTNEGTGKKNGKEEQHGTVEENGRAEILDPESIEQRNKTAGASAGYQQDGLALMKPQRVLRKVYAQPVEQNPDSQYRPIERPVRRFNTLKIPKNLQASLPFKSKPKQEKKQQKQTYAQKRAVVREPEERKAAAFMQQIQTLKNVKSQKEKEAAKLKHEKHMQKLQKEQEKFEPQKRLERKRKYKMQDLKERAKSRKKSSQEE
eukprot:gb/GECG01005973.1/.p1 GENE.gb/GECG01005973.1/~~gb/GECG01005973.1/.p1  ORF type:complete len:253 (+),score=61.28 gb/GECG01005973.1/:1-759(+)